MKKSIAAELLIILLPLGCFGCSATAQYRMEFPEDALLAEYVQESDQPMEFVEETENVQTVFFHRGN